MFADNEGNATFKLSDHQVSLFGGHSVVGRACVLHGFTDDLGKGRDAESLKTGNAGPRIACGVIGLSG